MNDSEDNYSSNDKIEKLHEQLFKLSRKKESQLEKKYEDLIKLRWILHSIIICAILIAILLGLLNLLILYIGILSIFIPVILFFYIISEIHYKKKKTSLININSNFKEIKFNEIISYKIYFYIFIIIIQSLILLISLILINPLLLTISITLNMIFIYFEYENN